VVKIEMRKLVLVVVLLAVLSPLLVNQGFAHQITAFAPINYAIAPVLPFPIWGNANSPPLTTSSFINPVEGWTFSQDLQRETMLCRGS
jgi:hypothetical protein